MEKNNCKKRGSSKRRNKLETERDFRYEKRNWKTRDFSKWRKATEKREALQKRESQLENERILKKVEKQLANERLFSLVKEKSLRFSFIVTN